MKNYNRLFLLQDDSDGDVLGTPEETTYVKSVLADNWSGTNDDEAIPTQEMRMGIISADQMDSTKKLGQKIPLEFTRQVVAPIIMPNGEYNVRSENANLLQFIVDAQLKENIGDKVDDAGEVMSAKW